MTWLEGLLETLTTCRNALGPSAAARHTERLRWIEELLRAAAPEQIIQEGRRRGNDPVVRPQQMLCQLVLEHATDLISVLTGDGTYVYANTAHVRVLGYGLPVLYGTSAFQRVHPDDSLLVNREWELLKKQGRAQAILRCQHANGSYRYLDAHAVAATRARGMQVVIISRSVTRSD